MNQTMNKTMKTVAIDRFGGLNEMKIRELPVPALDANEILVRVEAAGVGVWDPFEREGQAVDAQRALDDHYLGKLAITLN
jgi:NADPH:quinone reductase